MRFMIESSLKVVPTPEILALFPAESARGEELDAQGAREALYLAADMSRGWQVLRAASLGEAEALMHSFPLTPYSAYTITPLAEPQAG